MPRSHRQILDTECETDRLALHRLVSSNGKCPDALQAFAGWSVLCCPALLRCVLRFVARTTNARDDGRAESQRVPSAAWTTTASGWTSAGRSKPPLMRASAAPDGRRGCDRFVVLPWGARAVARREMHSPPGGTRDGGGDRSSTTAGRVCVGRCGSAVGGAAQIMVEGARPPALQGRWACFEKQGVVLLVRAAIAPVRRGTRCASSTDNTNS
jgi:hypothetical protein